MKLTSSTLMNMSAKMCMCGMCMQMMCCAHFKVLSTDLDWKHIYV